MTALEPEAETVAQGVAALDEGGTPFLDLDDDAALARLTAAEGSDYFELVKATAVVELYDNPLVWKAFGYEAHPCTWAATSTGLRRPRLASRPADRAGRHRGSHHS